MSWIRLLPVGRGRTREPASRIFPAENHGRGCLQTVFIPPKESFGPGSTGHTAVPVPWFSGDRADSGTDARNPCMARAPT